MKATHTWRLGSSKPFKLARIYLVACGHGREDGVGLEGGGHDLAVHDGLGDDACRKGYRKGAGWRGGGEKPGVELGDAEAVQSRVSGQTGVEHGVDASAGAPVAGGCEGSGRGKADDDTVGEDSVAGGDGRGVDG